MTTIHDVCETYKRDLDSINKITNRYERALHKVLYKLDHSFNIFEGCKYKYLGYERCPKMDINNFLKTKELCPDAYNCCIYHILLDALHPAEQKKLEFWKAQ